MELRARLGRVVCDVDVGGAVGGEEVVTRSVEVLTRELAAHAGFPLAVRFQVSGAGDAHDRLVADEERWVSELRAAATDLSDGSVWVEKVLVRTTCAPAGDTVSDEVLGDVLAALRDVELPDDELAALERELAKLPLDVRGDLHQAGLPDLVEEAKALLLARLASREAER